VHRQHRSRRISGFISGPAVSALAWAHQSCGMLLSSLSFLEFNLEYEPPDSTCSISLYNLILQIKLQNE
jgi:hypothetical protein